KNDRQVSLCVSTVKGDPRQWLTELRQADFFLCLPGSHMLMCHNAVEAISAGCIPILSYENWFCPNFENGLNCLAYRDIPGLHEALRTALRMDSTQVDEMRSNLKEYYERHLNCERAAVRVFGPSHAYRRMTVYMNHEDCDNYRRAGADSVLLCGGSLQTRL